MNTLKELVLFFKNLYSARRTIYELARRDLRSQYDNSILGVAWVYLQPLLFILVIYFVFSIGFRSKPATDGTPYSAWLICGMIAWLFFATTVSSCSNVINQYSFLVKKVGFSLATLPLVKLLSSLIPHLVFIGITLGLTIANDIQVSLYVFQIFYYLFAMSLLIVGLGWLTSSANVFIPDVGKLISLVVQFGLWLTPIFWNKTQVPTEFHWIINLNPMSYIVDGYRDSLLHQVGFWEKPIETLYFWTICISICIAGALIFRRLKPHFAEVI